MTSEELAEVVSEVLAAIRETSSPVTQLPVETVLDDSYSLPVTRGTGVYRISIPMIVTAVASLVAGQTYFWGGAAGPSTNPGTPAYRIVYEASVAGIYTHFKDANGDSLQVGFGEVVRLRWTGTAWTKEATDYVSKSFFHVVSEGEYEANKEALDATPAVHFIYEED